MRLCIADKGRAARPRQVREQEGSQAAGGKSGWRPSKKKGNLRLGLVRAAQGGAQQLQVNPTPVLDPGLDLKIFSDEGHRFHLLGPESAISSLQICAENVSQPLRCPTFPAKSQCSVHTRRNIWTPGKHYVIDGFPPFSTCIA